MDETIVIVGAGPTGLALGAELKRLGISALILDKLEAGANTSRAAAVHARTLEILEPMGIVPELLQQGLSIPLFHVRDRDRLLASIDFKNLKTKYPFVLVCPQNHTEAILLKKLQSFGGDVQRPCEVVAIHPEDNHVQVQYKSGNELKTVRTKWLVGCDGMHSVVRKQASIPFTGGDYEENFVLADVEMDWPLSRDEVNSFFSEKGLLAVVPLPENRFRLIATAKNPPSQPTIADCEQILRERGPKIEGHAIRRLFWSSRFRIHHRLAKNLRQGRVLIIGDAAHVHSPAGGQGMNIGIQDAVSLASVLKGGNDAALDIWEKERLQIARSVVKFTDRMTRFATVASPCMKRVRNEIIHWIGKIPFARNALAKKLSELSS